jgi:hypothetical protein
MFEYFSYLDPPIIITEERLKFLHAILTKEEYEKVRRNSIDVKIENEDYSLVTEEGLTISLELCHLNKNSIK